MNPELSVIMPAIRSERWSGVYESLRAAYSKPFELIIIGPTEPTKELMDAGDVRYVRDMGSPIRCQQIGFVVSRGKYVMWALDDGIFAPTTIDIAERMMGPKVAVMSKYEEGSGNTSHMHRDDYYYLSNHDDSRSLLLPNHYLGGHGPTIMNQSDLIAIGGWDCRYETCSIGYMDLAVRLQNNGISIKLCDQIMVRFGHMPGTSGDHGPMHYAQLENDEPLFRKIYGDPNTSNRTAVSMGNYLNSPVVWERRFKK